MNRIIEKIFSIPKSIYFNFRVLPFRQAYKLPIIVRYNALLLSTKGRVILKNKVYPNMISIGFGEVGVFDKKYSRSIIELNGSISFSGKVAFGHGSKLCVGKNAILQIGENFCNTAEGVIICMHNIKIHDNCVTSWNSLIMDTDFHNTINTVTGEVSKCCYAPIEIGNNVWIGTRSVILKRSVIPDGCIIGSNSTVNKKFIQKNCLIAGNPAVVKKENITLYRGN